MARNVEALAQTKATNCGCGGSGQCQGCEGRGCRQCSVRDATAGTWVGKSNKPAGTCHCKR